MADQQYDLPEKVIKLFRIKEEERKKAKAYFHKFITNPHRNIDDGLPFDTQVFRHSATHHYRFEHYKPTPKTSLVFMCVYILPVFIPWCFYYKNKSKEEEDIRSGKVAYNDRRHRGIY